MKARRQRCTARVSDGSRQCERWAINGSTVCATHGGRAPQVMKSARERLAELVEPALKGLNKALKSNDLPTIVRASQIVLDRCGFHPSKSIELTGKDGGRVEVENTINLDLLSIDEQRTLIEILEKAGTAQGNELAPICIKTLEAV